MDPPLVEKSAELHLVDSTSSYRQQFVQQSSFQLREVQILEINWILFSRFSESYLPGWADDRAVSAVTLLLITFLLTGHWSHTLGTAGISGLIYLIFRVFSPHISKLIKSCVDEGSNVTGKMSLFISDY